MPMIKRPPVSWLTVPPLMAKARGVRYNTGDTPIVFYFVKWAEKGTK